MKKFLGIIASMILALGLATPAQAHGGGLDWQGGHNCRVGSCAGTYHCHQPRGGACAKSSTPKPKNPSRFSTCSHARAAGVAPIYSSSSLYALNKHLDRDRDGIACE